MLAAYFSLVLVLASLEGLSIISLSQAHMVLAIFLIYALLKEKIWAIHIKPTYKIFEVTMIIFFVVGTISALFSIHKENALLHVIGLVAIFVFIKLSTLASDAEKAEKIVFLMVVACFVFLFLTATFFFFAQIYPSIYLHQIESHDVLVGFVHEKNHMGAFLQACFMLIGLSFVMQKIAYRKKVVFLLLGLVGCTFLLLETGSRTSILCCLIIIIAMLLLGLYHIFHKRLRQKRLLVFLAFVVILFSGVGMYIVKSYSNHHETRGMLSLASMTGKGGRIQLWEEVIKTTLSSDNNILGVGLGAQGDIIHQAGYKHLTTAHNSLLSIYIETGIVGLLASLMVLLSYLKAVFSFIRKMENKIEGIYLLACIFSLFLHSLFESYFFSQMLPFYFLFIFFYYYAAARVKDKQTSKIIRHKQTIVAMTDR